MTVVLDSSALLAVIQEEPGAEVVVAVLPEAVMLSVNLAEVATRLHDRGLTEDEVAGLIAPFDLVVPVYDADLAIATAALRPATRRLGLSLGDRACLALAQSLGAGIVTADRAWGALDLGVPVTVIR